MGVQNSERVPTVLLAQTIIWDGLFWTLNPKSWDSFFKIIARLTGSHGTTILGGKMAQRDPKVYEKFADFGGREQKKGAADAGRVRGGDVRLNPFSPSQSRRTFSGKKFI